MDALDPLAAYARHGGFVMPPLIVAAVLMWYGLGWRLVVLRRGSTRPLPDLVRAYVEGTNRPPRGVIDTAVARGVGAARADVPALRRRLDEAFFDLDEDLERYGTLVKAIVRVAPLTGLLGTVAGMIQTFDAIGEVSPYGPSGDIAGGISQALVSTQMGLAVAVPGLLAGRVLARRQAALGRELARLKDLLCSKSWRNP
jgi:biopolymer transport protein ExbB